ncbi:MAG: hypothetical protein M3426_02545 [Actinomycetota bacterium]|nr:hypothetical protein [Actinomycetota bacterium]
MLQRLAVLNQVAVVFGSVTQLLASSRTEPLTKRKVAETLLGWSLPLNLGVLETLWFVRHLRKGRSAEGGGQPAADRVLSELAVAHLAFGVLGLLALRFRGMFWFATVVGQAVFLGGVAAVNAREILKDKMYLFDVLMSLAHVGLLMVYDPLGAARLSAPTRRRRRWFGARS